ncbi:MAG: hypothetical protein Q8O24_05385 [Gallionellaceae bacterium]|nr:hypothetical protein [Gallionellaceae bacterium]
MHEITHAVKSLDLFCGQAMFALDNEALTEFARTFRPMPVADWLAMREKMMPLITEFMETPQAEWFQRWPVRLERTMLALAAFQLAREASLQLDAIREVDQAINRMTAGWQRQFASEAVTALFLCKQSAFLWPFEIGSPFQE